MIYQSPIGPLYLTANAHGLTGVHFSPADGGDVPAQYVRELDEYFAGTRTTFTMPLAPKGTAFQTTVWAALREIPYGETCSYADIAKRVGKPSAVRAVGLANGQNPIAIIVPCHRVIGSNGKLTGYAGGLHRKEWLLMKEGALRLDLRAHPRGVPSGMWSNVSDHDDRNFAKP